MTRDELNEVLMKISAIEGRQYAGEEAEAWFEILGGRNADDAQSAVVTFYSKPFTHRAYPGDINALVEEIETQRIASFGNLELNEADHNLLCEEGAVLTYGDIIRTLYRRARNGGISAEQYRSYQKSDLPLATFMARQEVPAGG